MSSGPLDFLSVVRRAMETTQRAPASCTPSTDESNSNPRKPAPELNAPRLVPTLHSGGDSTESPSLQCSPLAVAAKPYVPSYLAALKARTNATVALDGAMVSNSTKRVVTDPWCSSNFSNSALEQDTVSSWAEDDESFILSITRTQHSTMLEDSQWDGNPRKLRSQEGLKQPSCQKNRATQRGEKSGGRGWKKVEDHTSGSGAHHAGNNRKGRGGRRHNKSNSGSPSNISGGRFDVLANNSVMRHWQKGDER